MSFQQESDYFTDLTGALPTQLGSRLKWGAVIAALIALVVAIFFPSRRVHGLAVVRLAGLPGRVPEGAGDAHRAVRGGRGHLRRHLQQSRSTSRTGFRRGRRRRRCRRRCGTC